ncbi:hypothetical protein K438DRAFT_1867319 [Mycena galopus ATCC 62051]|nr:hypothetical protein K438DRAFT_1867319 [Mycena galopus ATCC 62051]
MGTGPGLVGITPRVCGRSIRSAEVVWPGTADGGKDNCMRKEIRPEFTGFATAVGEIKPEVQRGLNSGVDSGLVVVASGL